MNKWQETVKRISEQHPGESLTTILPLAKAEYRKMGHSSSTKKVKKRCKSSRGRRSTRGIRKGRKGKKSKKMNGGESSDTHADYQEFTGGSHCNTAKGHKKKRKRPKIKKPRRKSKNMGGGNCSHSCSGCTC